MVVGGDRLLLIFNRLDVTNSCFEERSVSFVRTILLELDGAEENVEDDVSFEGLSWLELTEVSFSSFKLKCPICFRIKWFVAWIALDDRGFLTSGVCPLLKSFRGGLVGLILVPWPDA